MTFISFLPKKPVSYEQLPLTLMTLDDWVLVNINGPDSQKYLQSQVTIDVTQMNEHQHLLAAHCNPQGKMWSTLRLFRRNTGFSFIERRSLCDIQLIALKKYAVFSNVNFIADDEIVLLGVAGFQARMVLTDIFQELPTEQRTMVNDGDTTILWFQYPSERFLLITNTLIAKYISIKLRDIAQFNNSQQWLSLDIEAGIPIIDALNSGKFIPQDVNLHKLYGINFKKGCYIGQETIVRTQYRNINRRTMLCLSGIVNKVPTIREKIEIKIGDNWRSIGTILAVVELDKGILLLQIVMNNHVSLNDVFRVRNDTNNTLSAKLPPYI